MIFKTFENNDIDKWTAKIGLFGKSFNDVIDSINKRKLDIDNLMSSGLVSSYSDAKKQVGGIFSYLYSKNDIKSQLIDVDTIFPKIDENEAQSILQQIKAIENGVHDEYESFQELYDSGDKQNQWIARYAQETQGQIRSTDGLIAANEKARVSAIAHNNALKQQTLGAKAASVAMKGLAMAGNMIAMFAITTAITLAVKAVSDYLNRWENAKEDLEQTESDLNSINQQIEDINSQISELQSKGSLSITEKQDLINLKEQNKELRIRQRYLEREKELKTKDVAKKAEEKYSEDYGRGSSSRSDIDKYKDKYNKTSKNNTPTSSYAARTSQKTDTTTNGYNTITSSYAARTSQKTDTTTISELAKQVADYEHYSELKKKALETMDSSKASDEEKEDAEKSYKKYSNQLDSLEQKLISSRKELQEYKDDIEDAGGDSPYLDDINSDLELIDDTLMSTGEDFVKFLNESVGDDERSKLLNLINSSDLNENTLRTQFQDIDGYLRQNGLTLEDLIALVKEYNEEISKPVTSSYSKKYQKIESDLSDLEEQYNTAVENRKKKYSEPNYVGNVDVNSRPVVVNNDGTYSTTSTASQEKWVGGEDDGHYIIGHFTPILPNGQKLDADTLNEYVDKILKSADPMEADKVKNGGYGIFYKVDTEYNGQEITDSNLKDAYKQSDQWDINQHKYQDKIYGTEGNLAVQIAEKRKQLGLQEQKEKQALFDDAWDDLDNPSNEDYKNTKKAILEVAEAGKLTDKTYADIDNGNAQKYFDNIGLSAEEAVKKINATVDSSKKLGTLKSGVTSVRNAYTEKKENKVAGADTLSSMESAFGNLKSWKNYKQTLGSTTSSLKECREAQNKLVTEYIDSNAFLDNIVDSTGKVDEATKQYYVSQLKELGIKNAEVVVNEKIKEQLIENTIEKYDFANMTDEEISSLIDECTQLGINKDEMKNYILQKMLANKSYLSTSASVSNLIALAKQCGITGKAIAILMKLQSSLQDYEDTAKLFDDNPTTDYHEENERQETLKKKQTLVDSNRKKLNKYLKKHVKTEGDVNSNVDSSDPNKNTKNTGGGGKNSSSDSKTQFDWIERRITNLQTRFDRWKTIIENSSLKFIDKYYKKATSYAKKLVNTEGSAYTKYMKKANGVKLNKSLKAKVRNGKISGKASDLIKEYGSKTADKIQKYQDYYEKATSALDSFVEKAQELYNLPLDKAAGKIEKFSDAIDLLEKKLDNAITATAKNKIIDDEVKQKKKTYDANKSANNKAQKNLKSAGKTLKKSVGKRQKKSITKAVKNGKEVDLAKFKEGSKAYKAAVKYNAALNAKTKAQQEKDVSEQEYNYYKDIEAPKTKFDNVKDEYENKLTVIDARIQDLDNQIDNIEASGATVDNSFYKEKKKQIDQKKALLIEEKNRLAESLKGIKKYSAEWYTANDEINKVNDSIAECTKTQYELNDAIAEGNKKIFEKKLEGYQRIIDEQDFLLGLIEHEDSVDSDTGVRTDTGNARLHSYTADYYASDEKVNIATAERQRLEKMKAAKQYGVGYEYSSLEALNNAINDTIKIQQENIASKYSIEKKIVDEVTKSYQAQMTVLQKLIDKKKEQLETEKDIYDYQKQIKEKTKNIDTLRKQLAAMNGDTSKEAMAQKQKLQVSLNDAVDDLKDTEYDRYISDISKMLDKLQKEYQEWQEKFLKKFDELLKEGLGIGDSTDGSYLATIAKNNGYNIQNPNANNNGKGGVNNDGSANGNTNPVKLKDDNSFNNNSSKPNSSAPKVNNKITAIGIESEETKAKKYINKNKSKSTKPLSHYSYVNQKIAAFTKDKHGTYVLNTPHLKGLAKLLGVKQDGNYKKSGKLAKKLHSIGLKGFSKGGVVSVDSLNKQIRANGDDGLASVKNGEAILTPAQTEMFKQFVENMQGNLPQQNHKMSNNLANLAKVIPNNIDYGGVNFNFELNNVTNGDEFIREIQTNQKMQKALQSVTVDKINGGGRLSVNRIK